MFWKKNKTSDASYADRLGAFEMAKEATRRATFLHLASQMPQGGSLEGGLQLQFRICRAKALAAGEAIGQSKAEVDRAIGAMCDQDVSVLKQASDEDIREFARQSGEIVGAFLASMSPQELASYSRT